MSFMTIQPDMLAAAASDLSLIGSAISADNAADEVSALTAAQFTAHAGLYQAVSAQAAAAPSMFVSTLGASAASYAAIEAANAVAAR
jgi:PE family protein